MLLAHYDLVDVPPVLAVIVEAFPHHGHDLAECGYAKCQLGDLRHQRAGWTPGVIGGRLAHFHFSLRVVVYNVLDLPSQGRGRHGYGRCVCVCWWFLMSSTLKRLRIRSVSAGREIQVQTKRCCIKIDLWESSNN